ncbi:MAG: CRTAC1 family protein, partial [Actinobacteria bacterium]|nr:CRTAC1 family protein [Actinomycetota bacterium]NIV58149.1 CRTAC1 family protein [Actinomycetota bacterium]NIV89682.1 CRTAC1 family protein [Actinomycetota bacterium]NIW31762.1 CRTAC1 family protein [Actinomycetota bacterium]NIX24063.1 CRTAC1 family protein [Actinomycetota bacterium]
NDAPAEVYRNVTPRAGGWLKLDVAAASGNRHAVGARVEVAAGGRTQVLEVRTASSYLSQNDMTL